MRHRAEVISGVACPGVIAWVATLVIASGSAGCEPVPDLYFPDAAGAIILDGSSDVREDGGSDATFAPKDAGIDSGTEAGTSDAGSPLVCLPASAPMNAGCCSSTEPCAGVGCMHCADCSCRPMQFCCAHLNQQGTYLGTTCSPDGKSCP